VNIQMNPERTLLVQCDYAMERLEAARVTVKVLKTVAIAAGSRERQNYDKFGQWPVLVDDGSMAGKTFQLVTRDNIPFFDPIKIGARTINATITGNLRQRLRRPIGAPVDRRAMRPARLHVVQELTLGNLGQTHGERCPTLPPLPRRSGRIVDHRGACR
jgi:hypothetical protein